MHPSTTTLIHSDFLDLPSGTIYRTTDYVSLSKTKEIKKETKQLQIKTIHKLPKLQSFPVPEERSDFFEIKLLLKSCCACTIHELKKACPPGGGGGTPIGNRRGCSSSRLGV